MTDNLTNHPQKDQLVAFGLGKLDPAEAEKIAEHLSSCHDCSETVINLQDDTFVSLVRNSPPPGPVQQDESQAIAERTIDAATGIGQDTRQATELPRELRDHPRYEILELIGRGGMGDVYKAQHKVMNRVVALKVIKPELVQNEAAVTRFHREVQAAARLHHGNIVTAHDAEQAGHLHYLVMEFVDGVNLDEVIRDRGSLPVDKACKYIRQAANGLQHAHEHGMVHRDIKPHNLMLSLTGELKILDFGLAILASEVAVEDAHSKGGSDLSEDGGESVAAESSAMRQLTQMGTMMGTPDYIAPEQAQDAHTADIRADIYSLGCTFYYLLTGRPPFQKVSVMDKVKAHAQLEPEALESVRVDVPADVADIISRMMAKDPAERFQTPAELANALGTFVDKYRTDKPPIRGAGFQTAQTASKKADSKPVQKRSVPGPLLATGLAIVGCLALAVAAVVIYVKTDYGTVRIEVDDPNTTVTIDGDRGINVQKPDGGKLTVRAGDHKLYVKQGDLEFETDRFRVRRGEEVVLNVELIGGKLGARLKGSNRVIGLQRDDIRAEEVAIRTRAGTYWRFDGDNQPVMTNATTITEAETFTLEWQNADHTLAYVRTPGNLYLRGVVNHKDELAPMDERGTSELLVVEWMDRQRRTFRLRTRDGEYVAPGSGGGHLTTVPDAGSVEAFTLVPPAKAIRDEATNHSDDPATTASDRTNVRAQAEPVRVIQHGGSISSLAWMPDGTIVTTARDDDAGQQKLYFLDRSSTGAENGLLDDSNHVVVSADGKWLVTGSRLEKKVALWDAKLRELVKTFDVGGLVHGVSISPDSKLLAAASWGGPANVWSVESHELVKELGGYGRVHRVQFSPDGKMLAVSETPSGRTDLCDTSTWEKRTGFTNGYGVGQMAFSPDGNMIATGGNGLKGSEPSKMWVRVWDASSGEKLMEFKEVQNAVAAVAISPDSRYLIAVGGNWGNDPNWGGEPHEADAIRIWDLNRKQLVAEFDGHDGWVRGIAFAPDGEHFATINKEVKVWNLKAIVSRATGSEIQQLAEVRRFGDLHTRPVADVASLPSPEGMLVATASYDGTMRIWDVGTGREAGPFLDIGDENPKSVAAAPGGKTIALGDHSGKVHLWDVERATVDRTVIVEKGHVYDLAFSPNGTKLYVGMAHYPDHSTGTVVVYDAESWERLRELENVGRGVQALAPLPDNVRVLTTTAASRVGVWDGKTGRVLTSFRDIPAAAYATSISPDGSLAALGFRVLRRRDGRWDDPEGSGIWLYDVETGRVVRKLRGHTGFVNDVAFTPDGRFLVSGSGGHHTGDGFIRSWDNTLRVWNAETGVEIARVELNTEWGIWRLALLPDGRHVVTASSDDGQADLRLWKLPESVWPAADPDGDA